MVATAVLAFVTKSYFVAFQSILALILFLLPTILDHRFNIELPDVLETIVILFIFSSIFLGEIRGFYEQYPLWDKLLHISSGFLTAAIGFSLIDILNRHGNIGLKLSPIFVAIFGFCFSMTVGVVWEFFEFGMDQLLGFDMQKDVYITQFSSVLLGDITVNIESVVVNGVEWESYVDIGLIDTMQDLIVNAIGAVVFSIFGWIYITKRGKKGWIENLLPRTKSEIEKEISKKHREKEDT